MVDRSLLASAIADIRDAVARIREVVPADAAAFAADRTAREVVLLNLFVALQQCLAVAVHWIADAGKQVPGSYRYVLIALAAEGVLPADLAARLGAAAGLRNLIAHGYGAVDWRRIHDVATTQPDDLLAFSAALAIAAERSE